MMVTRVTVIWVTLSSAAAAAPPPPAVTIDQRFSEIRKNPGELYAFLLRMPKGADLHMHLGGSVYAETYLRLAAADGSCVDLRTYSLTLAPCGPNTVAAAQTQTDNNLAGLLIDSLSMRNFVPGRESGHDHFFAAFGKFGPIQTGHLKEMLGEVVHRSAEQNESYLEVMTLSGFSATALGNLAGLTAGFDAAKDKLTNMGLPLIVQSMRDSIDKMDQDLRGELGCDARPDSPACRIAVRHVYQVLREFPKEQVFAQVLAGFMLASLDPRVAGVNFVQPEDGIISMRDYHLHMQMVDYAKRLYPKVHVTLHAGELASGLVPPDGLRFHIREAVELGHAERIGHGVDIMYETDASKLLEEMKQRHVMVEINLSSNDLILGIRGKEHPFPVYRAHGVPVALSTDDEGVSRIHLTEEYVRAVETYNLSYADLKEMVRNSLEYSFLPGDSYWSNHSYRVPVAACGAGTAVKSCQTFLKANEKARMQVDLEERFRLFEKTF